MSGRDLAGGCLCGALRWRAKGEPEMAGLCYCRDCRRASGGGGIGFMGFSATALAISGKAARYASASFRGTEAVRNFCPVCGSLVFGGVWGLDSMHTIYAGTLDDAALFVPEIAIFDRDRPAWMPLPPGLQVFETMPE